MIDWDKYYKARNLELDKISSFIYAIEPPAFFLFATSLGVILGIVIYFVT